MNRTLYIILLLLLASPGGNNLVAQDSLFVAPTPEKSKTRNVSSMRATMLAASFPGLGQVYNRKYWKVPFVYAGFGGVGYAVTFNSKQYNKYTRAYQDFTDNVAETDSYISIIRGQTPDKYDPILHPDTYDPDLASWIRDQLLRQVDYYRKYRDLSYFGIVAWYLVTILDANVDASLFNYEIDENLDLTVAPVVYPSVYSYSPGVSLTMTINF